MNSKIVFLDIDGVICVYPEYQFNWIGNENDRLSGLCCKYLKEILDTTQAKIVITSSWRLSEKNSADLYRQLEKHGIAKDYIIGQTASLSSDKNIKTHNELRWFEIKDYIEKNGITDYIILDDFNLDKYDKPHLVKTKKHTGITEKLKEVCIEKLSRKSSQQ